MKKFEVGYLTEDPAKEYSYAIRKAQSRDDLIKVITYYRIFAEDALKQAKTLTEDDFKDLMKDIKKANKQQSAEWTDKFMKRFGDIVIPMKLIRASMASMHFHAPWGLAFIRGEEIEKSKK